MFGKCCYCDMTLELREKDEFVMELINNNQVPPGYKKTEVGVIPEDWEAKLLGDIFCLKNGFSFKSEYFSSSGPIVLTPGNFKLDGGLYFNERNIKRYSGSFPESMIFKNGDLLVVMTDLTPDCNLLGKPAFVDSEETILHNQRIGKINLLSESIDQFFLYFILLSSPYLKKIKEQATGSTVRHTSNKSIYSICLPIPKTKEEQKAIAQTLSDVDALIAALDKHIAKKCHIKTATMQQLLTGKTRLPGFGEGKGYKKSAVGVIPEDWEVFKFTDITTLITCGIAATPEYVSETQGYPFLSSTNVKNGQIIWKNFKYITKELHQQLYRNNPPQKGAILYSRVGTIGEAAVIEVDFDFSIYVSLTLIKTNSRLHNYFLVHLLNSFFYKKRANDEVYLGGGVGNLNVNVVRNYPIIVPPLPEQKAIAQVLSDIDSAIATCANSLSLGFSGKASPSKNDCDILKR